MAQSTLPTPATPVLHARLGGARNFWRVLITAEGALWTTAALALAFLLLFHLDRWLVFSIEARVASWAVLGTLLAGCFFFLVLRPLFQPRSDEQVAKLVERRYPALAERLLSAVEFAGARPEQLRGFSSALVEDLQAEAAREAAGLDFRAAVDRRGVGRAGMVFAVVAALLALHLLIAPQAFGAFLSRMALNNTPVWRDTRVQVSPYPRVRVLKGSDLVVGVDQEGRRMERAQLHFRFGDGRWNQVTLSAAKDGDFTHRFTTLTESMTYFATAGDGRSDTGAVEVVDAAAIVGAKVRMEYPAYLQRPPTTLTAQSGGIAAPVGTRVALELRSSKPLASAEVTLPKAAPAPWLVRGDITMGALIVTGNGQYSVRLKDSDGFTASDAQVFPIKAILDQAPEVHLLEPTGDLDVTPDARIHLSIHAQDDNGVAEVRVPYQTSGAWRTQPAGRGDRRAKRLELENQWDLAPLGLKPGDTLRYRVEATDWDNLSGPHVGKTSEFQLRIIDRGEAERRYEEQRADVERQLADLIKEQQAAKAEVAQQRAAAHPNAEAVAGAEERQRGTATTAADLARRLADLNRTAETNNIASQAERDAQKMAAGKLGQLAQGAMPQAADRIGAAQAQASSQPSAARSELGQAEGQQQQILDELRRVAEGLKPTSEAVRMAERFERLAKEQRALQSQADQLLPATIGKRMDELTADQKARLGQLAQAQTNLQRATAQAMQDLDQTANSMAQRGAEGAESAQQASQGLKESGVSEQQSGAAQNAQQNALGQARSQQENAAQALENAAQELRAGANPNDPRQLQRELQQAQRQLRKLVQGHSDAMEKSRRQLTPQQRQQLERQQRELAKQAQALARQLQRLERRAPATKQASSALEDAGQNMSQAAQATAQGNRQEAQDRQNEAQRALLRAMQSLEQAMAEAGQKDDEDPFKELRKELTGLLAGQKLVTDSTKKIADEQAKRGARPEDAAEVQRQARRQAQVEEATGRLEPRLPGDVFRAFSRSARDAMTRAKSALDAGDPKDDPTGRAQERAQTLLEQLVRALTPDPKDNDESQGGGGGQGGGQGGEKDPDLPKRIAEIRLLRFLEQDVRRRTQELDDNRKPREPLSEEERRQVDETAQQQAGAKSLAERVGRALGRYPNLSGKVGQAGKHMGEAQRGLDQSQTGDGVQEQETQAIIRLTEALKQAQQQAKSQSQSQSRKQSRGQQQQGQQRGQQAGTPQAGTQQGGNAPAMRSLQRRANRSDGPLSENPFGARGFGGLDPRAQDALRQSFKEKSPAEYQELIDRYYRALSNRGR